MEVIVVGGGITGLAAGWLLADAGVDVVVLEGSDRLGGKIRTRTIDGTRLDVGADALVARRPEACRLVRRVGLGDAVVAPSTSDVWLWTREALRPFPDGTLFGAPTALVPLATSGALSWRGVARAALEPLLPRRNAAGDVAVGRLVTDRFGREVTDALVAPLLGGIYAGDVDRLDLRAAAAPLAAAAARHRSLLLGARTVRGERDGSDPAFLTVRGGLGRLVGALASDLGERVVTNAPVTRIRRAERARWRVTADAGRDADAVVLTVPAPVASALLRDVAPEAAALLGEIRYASVGTVTLGYERSSLPGLPAGSGMLVPPREGRLVKAVTWTSAKWGHRGDTDRFWMRASVGHIDDTAALRLPDTELGHRVADEVAEAMDLGSGPETCVVTRWPDALPQYEVGHLGLVRRIRRGAPPGVHLAGAAYDGVGIAPCVAQAEAVARTLTAGPPGR